VIAFQKKKNSRIVYCVGSRK